MNKINILQRDTYLDILEESFPLLTPLPSILERENQDTKMGLALARLIDLITLKETYTLKKRGRCTTQSGETAPHMASAEKNFTFLILV